MGSRVERFESATALFVHFVVQGSSLIQMSTVVITCFHRGPRMKVPIPVRETGYYRRLLAWHMYYTALEVSVQFSIRCYRWRVNEELQI